MKAFVLILMINYVAHGTAATTADFDSQAACEAAGKAAVEKLSWLNSATYVCAAKGL